MPICPGHWAGVSGSLECNDVNPLEAALREVRKKTNLGELFEEYFGGENEDGFNLSSCMKQGLHLDMTTTKCVFGGGIIQMYPFALTLPAQHGPTLQELETQEPFGEGSQVKIDPWSAAIEMRGTDHDQMHFFSVDEFLKTDELCVPGLKLAFHHATSGSYLELPGEIRTWEQDRVSGAGHLARQAVMLAYHHADAAVSESKVDAGDIPSIALSIAMLRPSMVPIVNLLNEFDRRVQIGEERSKVRDDLLKSLTEDCQRCVGLGTKVVLEYKKQWHSDLSSSDLTEEFVVGTFSRSRIMKSIIGRLLETTKEKYEKVKVVCSQSTPGNEGELMAADMPDATWLSDVAFEQHVRERNINLVLVGADCIQSDGTGVVNKLGTAALARVCKQSDVPILCCADRWKLWDDHYPPGLEEIFEVIPRDLLHEVLVPL